ncbi:MAG TPA: peptidoglycan DD-metalloendopeptidase family protein [Marmoricola sp.]
MCTLAVAASGPVPNPAHADDLKDKKKRVEKNIEHAQGDLEDSSAAVRAAAHRLSNARAQLAAAERRLAVTEGQLTAARVLDAQMQAKLVQAEQALVDAKRELTEGIAAVTEQRAAIGRLAADSFQYGDPRLVGLTVLLNAQTPEDVTTQMGVVDGLLDRQTAMFDQLRAAEALLRVQKDKVAEARVVVAEQRRVAAANLVRRQALEQAAEADRAEVVVLVNQRGRASAAARRARQADLVKLRQLKKEEARIKRLILARARNQKGGYSGASGGFLERPVPGEVTSPFGMRRHPIYGYYGLHNGTDFRAPCGTPQRAGAAGTVIAKYYSSVWGNRLFLDVGRVNGKAMTLVYNHISSYRAGSGERVARGEVVSYSGTTGWSTACHLHFTVLLDGSPVDPENYL